MLIPLFIVYKEAIFSSQGCNISYKFIVTAAELISLTATNPNELSAGCHTVHVNISPSLVWRGIMACGRSKKATGG
jgi:hypothetical protein